MPVIGNYGTAPALILIGQHTTCGTLVRPPLRRQIRKTELCYRLYAIAMPEGGGLSHLLKRPGSGRRPQKCD
jgi:hypothetical protein